MSHLVIVMGATGYIGKQIIMTQSRSDFNFIGLSRGLGEPELQIYQYGSRSVTNAIESASAITVINCIQHLDKDPVNVSRSAFFGNFAFPKRQIRRVEAIFGDPVRVIQLSSYWEDIPKDRGLEKNSYVLAKKSFSYWLRKRRGTFSELVVGDVIGPQDFRQKIFRIALEKFPEPPDYFIANPSEILKLTTVERILENVSDHLQSGADRIVVPPDWTISVEGFVDAIYAVLSGSKGSSRAIDPSLTTYLRRII